MLFVCFSGSIIDYAKYVLPLSIEQFPSQVVSVDTAKPGAEGGALHDVAQTSSVLKDLPYFQGTLALRSWNGGEDVDRPRLAETGVVRRTFEADEGTNSGGVEHPAIDSARSEEEYSKNYSVSCWLGDLEPLKHYLVRVAPVDPVYYPRAGVLLSLQEGAGAEDARKPGGASSQRAAAAEEFVLNVEELELDPAIFSFSESPLLFQCGRVAPRVEPLSLAQVCASDQNALIVFSGDRISALDEPIESFTIRFLSEKTRKPVGPELVISEAESKRLGAKVRGVLKANAESVRKFCVSTRSYERTSSPKSSTAAQREPVVPTPSREERKEDSLVTPERVSINHRGERIVEAVRWVDHAPNDVTRTTGGSRSGLDEDRDFGVTLRSGRSVTPKSRSSRREEDVASCSDAGLLSATTELGPGPRLVLGGDGSLAEFPPPFPQDRTLDRDVRMKNILASEIQYAITIPRSKILAANAMTVLNTDPSSTLESSEESALTNCQSKVDLSKTHLASAGAGGAAAGGANVTTSSSVPGHQQDGSHQRSSTDRAKQQLYSSSDDHELLAASNSPIWASAADQVPGAYLEISCVSAVGENVLESSPFEVRFQPLPTIVGTAGDVVTVSTHTTCQFHLWVPCPSSEEIELLPELASMCVKEVLVRRQREAAGYFGKINWTAAEKLELLDSSVRAGGTGEQQDENQTRGGAFAMSASGVMPVGSTGTGGSSGGMSSGTEPLLDTTNHGGSGATPVDRDEDDREIFQQTMGAYRSVDNLNKLPLSVRETFPTNSFGVKTDALFRLGGRLLHEQRIGYLSRTFSDSSSRPSGADSAILSRGGSRNSSQARTSAVSTGAGLEQDLSGEAPPPTRPARGGDGAATHGKIGIASSPSMDISVEESISVVEEQQDDAFLSESRRDSAAWKSILPLEDASSFGYEEPLDDAVGVFQAEPVVWTWSRLLRFRKFAKIRGCLENLKPETSYNFELALVTEAGAADGNEGAGGVGGGTIMDAAKRTTPGPWHAVAVRTKKIAPTMEDTQMFVHERNRSSLVLKWGNPRFDDEDVLEASCGANKVCGYQLRYKRRGENAWETQPVVQIPDQILPSRAPSKMAALGGRASFGDVAPIFSWGGRGGAEEQSSPDIVSSRAGSYANLHLVSSLDRVHSFDEEGEFLDVQSKTVSSEFRPSVDLVHPPPPTVDEHGRSSVVLNPEQAELQLLPDGLFYRKHSFLLLEDENGSPLGRSQLADHHSTVRRAFEHTQAGATARSPNDIGRTSSTHRNGGPGVHRPSVSPMSAAGDGRSFAGVVARKKNHFVDHDEAADKDFGPTSLSSPTLGIESFYGSSPRESSDGRGALILQPTMTDQKGTSVQFCQSTRTPHQPPPQPDHAPSRSPEQKESPPREDGSAPSSSVGAAPGDPTTIGRSASNSPLFTKTQLSEGGQQTEEIQVHPFIVCEVEDLTPESHYVFQIAAVTHRGVGAFSKEFCFSTLCHAPRVASPVFSVIRPNGLTLTVELQLAEDVDYAVTK